MQRRTTQVRDPGQRLDISPNEGATNGKLELVNMIVEQSSKIQNLEKKLNAKKGKTTRC